MAKLINKGGKGSGNWGHAGRPGKVGGSAPRDGAYQQGELFDTEKYEAPPDPYDRLGDQRNNIDKLLLPVINGKEPDVGYDEADDWYTDMRYSLDEEFPNAYNIAGEAKNKLITFLSEDTGVDYDIVNRIIKQWSYGSNRSPESMFMQWRVATLFHDKFGTELSDYQKKLSEHMIGVSPDDPDFGDAITNMQQLIAPEDDPVATMDAVLLSMYNQTQRQLAAFDDDRVSLARGVYTSAYDNVTPGDVSSVDENAMESWSSSENVAYSFSGGDHVLKTFVPKERILATPFSGYGCLAEREFIVLGANITDKETGTVLPDIATVVR